MIMRVWFVFALVSIFFLNAFAQEFQQLPTDKGSLFVNISTDPIKPKSDEITKLEIGFVNPKTNNIQEHIDYQISITKGDTIVFGPIPLTHTSTGSVTIPVEFKEGGEHQITVSIEGILFQPIPLEIVTFTKIVEDASAQQSDNDQGGEAGGCLIATATHGTELATQVQILREIREDVIKTDSGTAFMTTFNGIYYLFSPTIADWERQNSVFRGIIKITIIPMLSSLSILDHVDINSEQEMIGYGISVILINIGIYFVIPVLLISKLHKF
jgi:hypothetical protein